MSRTDKAQLRQVRAAILGNRPDTSLSSTLYPVYVAVIAAGTYGVPAAQQLFRSINEKWLAEHARTPAGAMAAVTLAAVVLALVRLVGRVHGPVVPPLPYLELVVASPMPRKVTLARCWRGDRQRRPTGRAFALGSRRRPVRFAGRRAVATWSAAGAAPGIVTRVRARLPAPAEAPKRVGTVGHRRSAEAGSEQCHHGRSRPRRGSAHGSSRRRTTHDPCPARAVESQRATGGDRPP